MRRGRDERAAPRYRVQREQVRLVRPAARRAEHFTRDTVRALLPLYRADYRLFNLSVNRWYAALAGERFVRGLGLQVAGEDGSVAVAEECGG